MLLQKKQSVPQKIHFSAERYSNGWGIFVAKQKTDTKSFVAYIPTSDITICYQPETDTQLAEVTTCFDNTKVVMKASMFSDQTRRLGVELRGYDQSNRCVVSFQESDSRITVAPGGMEDSFEGEDFYYCCSSENITFQNKKQTVMQMYPTFVSHTPGLMKIKGWIYESYLSYLPYLSGLLGYVILI